MIAQLLAQRISRHLALVIHFREEEKEVKTLHLQLALLENSNVFPFFIAFPLYWRFPFHLREKFLCVTQR